MTAVHTVAGLGQSWQVQSTGTESGGEGGGVGQGLERWGGEGAKENGGGQE